jgi:hypothetical protein
MFAFNYEFSSNSRNACALMKPLFCFVLAAGVAVAAVLSAAPSSDEYQALIREATQRYRGDFTHGQIRVTASYSYYEIDPLYQRWRSREVPPPLAPGAFASIFFSMKEDPAILLSPAPNQTLQLTTTAPRPEKLFDDLFPPTAIDTRYR